MSPDEFLIAAAAFVSVYAELIKQWLLWFWVAGFFLAAFLGTGLALRRGLNRTL
jgi:hypothetical protein